MDIGLPSLNGLDVAKRIRQMTPNARIIFLTSYSDRDVIREALSTGAEGYVVKANAWAELFTAIEGGPLGEQLKAQMLAKTGVA